MNKKVMPILFLIALSICIGLLSVFIPDIYKYLFLFLIILTSVIFILRKYTRNDNSIDTLDVEGLPDYRRERKLYYLATLFVGQVSIRPFAGLTISDMVFIGALLSLIFLMLVRRRFTYIKIPFPLMIGLVIFIVGGVISSLGATIPMESLGKIFRLPYIILVWFLLGMVLLNKTAYIKTSISLWVISMSINGVVAILQLAMEIPFTLNEYGRMTAFTDHFNDLGGSASIAWVPALALATITKGFKSLLFHLSLIALGMGVILSGSVSGLLTVIVGTALWIFIGKPNKKFIIATCLIAISVSSVIQVQTSKGYVTPMSRLQSTSSSGENGTILNRFETYGSAIQEISNNPLIGSGYDSVSILTDRGYQVHNIYLAQLYQGGLLAFLGMIILTFFVLFMGFYCTKKARNKEEYVISISLLIAFMCTIAFGMTAPILYQRYAWIPAALIIPLYTQLRFMSLTSKQAKTNKSNEVLVSNFN